MTPVPMNGVLIVNPSAGGGRALRLLPAVETALHEAGWSTRTERTRDLPHADALAASASARGEVCWVLGGDGLIGRVAGVLAGTDGVLAPLPGGRGNDFVRMLGLPRDPVEVVTRLAGGTATGVDVGEVVGADGVGRVFVGIASVGFDSDVQVIANATTRVRGQAVYGYAALRAIAGWRHATFTLSLDGAARELTGWSVAAANSQYYGGGMRLAPAASLTDGQLDVVTTSATSKSRFLRSFPRVFRGTHVRRPSVTVVGARELTIAADRPFEVYADGDPIAPLPVTIRVRPQALRVLLTA